MRGSYPASENSLPTMQKERTYIFGVMLAAVFLAVVLVSCSKESSEPMAPTETPLVFSPTAGWPEIANGSAASAGSDTKALITSASELQQYGISLIATASKDANIYVVFNNDLLKYSNSAWNYDITKYWIPGASYSFTAFAPYATNSRDSKSISNGTVSSTGTETAPQITIANYISGKVSTGSPQFDARSEDLLFASHIRDNTTGSDYSSVPLHFDHLLSCLSFKIRNATSTDIETVESISLTGLQYEADINVSNITATISPTAKTVGESDGFFAGINMTGTTENPFLPRGMSEEQFKDLFDCTDLTVLPQTIYGKEIKIKFTVRYSNSSSTDYSGNLGTIEGITRWQPGKKYRYNITISSQDIIFQVSEIPWIEHNVEL